MKRVVFGVCAALCCICSTASAQKSLRDSAFALVDSGKSVEALPLLEKLAASNPTDIAAFERLGLTLLKTSGVLSDAEARRLQRVRARAAFETAAKLGSTSNQILGLLRALPADGGPDASFSANADVEDAMKQAETAFSAGDYRTAFTFYQKALALDPNSYSAAMFSGDTYVHTASVDSAYVWYARATQINPNIETAWRYWSDVLLKHDKPDEAREKAIEAVIAEPYNRLSMSALSAWAGKTKSSVAYPRVGLAAGTAAAPSTPARLVYDSVRRAWKGDGAQPSAPFKAAYATETVYRHSVAEERAALRAAYRVDPGNAGTNNLQKMDEAGVLDAFILLAGADQGIAAEYANYRRDFRDTLRKFWTSFVIGAPYAK